MLKSDFVPAQRRGLFALLAATLSFAAGAAQLGQSDPRAPKIAPASDEGAKAIKKFRLPPGLKADLFAAEPLLANPVAIATDEQGRWYVAETFRPTDGALDIRGVLDWLDEAPANQTVEDRVAVEFSSPRRLWLERAVSPRWP